MKATVANVPVMLRNIGAVQAYNSVLVRARVDGTLDKVLFHEGQDVKAGSSLRRSTPGPYAAALPQALAKQAADQAMLANAKRDLARYQQPGPQRLRLHASRSTRRPRTVAQIRRTSRATRPPSRRALNVDFTQINSPITAASGCARSMPAT